MPGPLFSSDAELNRAALTIKMMIGYVRALRRRSGNSRNSRMFQLKSMVKFSAMKRPGAASGSQDVLLQGVCIKMQAIQYSTVAQMFNILAPVEFGEVGLRPPIRIEVFCPHACGPFGPFESSPLPRISLGVGTCPQNHCTRPLKQRSGGLLQES